MGKKHSVLEIAGLLPQLDCGACGNPACGSFARRICANIQKPEECPFLTKENAAKAKGLLQEGADLEPVSEQPEEVVEIQPCAEYGKVTLEAQLRGIKDSPFDLFDLCRVCVSFHDIKLFEKVSCSLDMGYILAEHGGEGIHIFRNGKIVMRRVKDRDYALQTLKKVSRALWPSVICSCGNTAVECAGGACSSCPDICEAVSWGISGSNAATGKPAEKTFADRIRNNEKFSGTINRFDEVLKLLRSAKVLENKGKITSLLDEARMLATGVMVSTGNDREAAVGLSVLGLEQNVRRVARSLFEYSGNDEELFKKSTGLFWDAMRARDAKTAKHLAKSFNSFFKEWQKDDRKDASILRIATSGLYVARLVSRPVPA